MENSPDLTSDVPQIEKDSQIEQTDSSQTEEISLGLDLNDEPHIDEKTTCFQMNIRLN